MIDKLLARTIIGDFRILTKFPATEEGVEALAEALRGAANEQAARRIARQWIQDNRRCPAPCDLYAILKRTVLPPSAAHYHQQFPTLSRGEQAKPAEYNCNQCEDSGWYMVDMGFGPWDAPDQHYKTMKRCPHPLSERGAKAVRATGYTVVADRGNQ